MIFTSFFSQSDVLSMYLKTKKGKENGQAACTGVTINYILNVLYALQGLNIIYKGRPAQLFDQAFRNKN